MKKNDNTIQTHFVSKLPDLMGPEDYPESDRKKIKIQIRMTDSGIEILGDSMYPHLLEELLSGTGAKKIEGVLCG
ncbi:hypothetical protein QUF76_02750 [Desulfobacterales bacterium HSG16]|nr:hypothetical protein [Desulfobacterales bacterium HSG16]